MPDFDQWCREQRLLFKHPKNKEAARIVFERMAQENELLSYQVASLRKTLESVLADLENLQKL